MPIIVNLDVMMAKRKISLGDLAEKIDLTPANLSIMKTKIYPLLHTGSYLQRIRLPARRHSGVS